MTDQRKKPEAPENDSVSTDQFEGFVPPHDLDAEAAVLSACLLRGVAAVDEVTPHLDAREFYSEAHRRIFEACVDLAQSSQPVDAVQVGGWLKDRQRLAQVGGMPYLGQILDAAPNVFGEHLRAYARRVRNRYRLRILAYKLRVATAEIYGGGVPDEATEQFLDRLERDVSEICASRHTGSLQKIGPTVLKVISDFEKHQKAGGGIVGIPTGFDRLDRKLGGLHDGDLSIVAARPGLGKTALVMGICDNVTDRGYAGAVFSLEMPRDQLVARLLCSRGRVNLSKSRMGEFSEADWSKLTQASSAVFPKSIYLDDTAGQTLAMIRSKVRRLVAQLDRERCEACRAVSDRRALCVRCSSKRLGVVIIDYLQLMRTRQRKGGETRSELIGEITRGLKELAKELGVPIVLLSQLNREVEKREDKRPHISDLRDSGEIEQDSDNILLLYRDDYYDADSDERGIAEVIIGKQRNGPTGVVKLRFDKEWTRFDNLAEEIGGEEIPKTDGQPYERLTHEQGGFTKDPEPPEGFFDDL